MKGIIDMTYTKKTTENLRRLAALSDERNGIAPDMYTEHAVFRGLRDMSGNGVVTGLTEISTIKAKEKAPDGSVHTCPGELYYRGYNICDWSAHRLEKLQNAGKIIRPAYIGVKPVQEYVPIENR